MRMKNISKSNLIICSVSFRKVSLRQSLRSQKVKMIFSELKAPHSSLSFFFSKYSYKCTGGLSFGAISVGRLYAANPHEQEGHKTSTQYLLVLLLLVGASSPFSIYAANPRQQEGFKSETNYFKVSFPKPNCFLGADSRKKNQLFFWILSK